MVASSSNEAGQEVRLAVFEADRRSIVRSAMIGWAGLVSGAGTSPARFGDFDGELERHLAVVMDARLHGDLDADVLVLVRRGGRTLPDVPLPVHAE